MKTLDQVIDIKQECFDTVMDGNKKLVEENKNLEHQTTILKKDLNCKEGVIKKQNTNIKEHNELKGKQKKL